MNQQETLRIAICEVLTNKELKLPLKILEFEAMFEKALQEERQLLEHREKITLDEELDEYSNWLHKQGYIDTDYYAEEPTAVKEYLRIKEKLNESKTKKTSISNPEISEEA